MKSEYRFDRKVLAFICGVTILSIYWIIFFNENTSIGERWFMLIFLIIASLVFSLEQKERKEIR